MILLCVLHVIVLLCLRAVNKYRLRTNGVDTNGVSAKVIFVDRLGKKVRPGTFGKIKVGKQEYPKSPSVKKNMKKK